MIARIENGAIVEYRNIAITDVPEHKRGAWLPIEGVEPAYVPDVQTIDGPSYAIDGNVVRATWTIANKVFTASDVRAEAQRRIIALVGATDLNGCLIKQLNANMLANELSDIRFSRALTPAEEAMATALRNLADAIKAIRAKSNLMEANPPSNYANDVNWV